ncbi:hypothetical protein D3C72_2512760 [compost metagenome]
MPMGAKPSQPRIRAGVSSKPTMVDSSRAKSGETVSLTPRSNWVNNTNTSSDGIISIMIRA